MVKKRNGMVGEQKGKDIDKQEEREEDVVVWGRDVRGENKVGVRGEGVNEE